MITNRKIKVLRIINRFNIGGPTYNAAFLSKYISDDFETLLVGGLPEKDESDSLYILKEHGLTPLLLHEMKRKPDFFSDRKAYLKIKQQAWDDYYSLCYKSKKLYCIFFIPVFLFKHCLKGC
jgi:hypothetical protein